MAKQNRDRTAGWFACIYVCQGTLLAFGYIAPAHAYLDPGTGSIILQGLLAGIVAVAAAGGIFWQRIKTVFSSLFSSGKQKEADQDQDQ